MKLGDVELAFREGLVRRGGFFFFESSCWVLSFFPLKRLLSECLVLLLNTISRASAGNARPIGHYQITKQTKKLYKKYNNKKTHLKASSWSRLASLHISCTGGVELGERRVERRRQRPRGGRAPDQEGTAEGGAGGQGSVRDSFLRDTM